MRVLSILLFVVGLLSTGIVEGRTPWPTKAERDSLKALQTGLRAALHRADSAGDLRARIDARFELAPQLKGKEQVRLLLEAAALAEEAARPDVQLKAHRALAIAYRTTGDGKRAWEQQALVVEALDRQVAALELRAQERADSLQRRNRQEQEDLRADLARTGQQVAVEAQAERQRGRTWMIVLGGVTLVAVLWSLLGRMRARRDLARWRSTIVGLTARVRELEERAAVAPVALVRTEVRPSTSRTTLVPESGVLAVFRMRGADRLAALQDALQRDDQEKVVRVVHTLKPHLVALDEARFGGLCADITAGPGNDREAWGRSVQQLARAVAELLGDGQ